VAISAEKVKELARECGFELAGVAPAQPLLDFERFEHWRRSGFAGEMTYLKDRRGDMRRDPCTLLPGAQSVVSVGKLYNTPHPFTSDDPERGWISRYAWGADYHSVLRKALGRLIERIAEVHQSPFEWKICVDTAPLLERSYAQAAGLGWIGKNSCLINQQQGSWFFLGELLLSIPLAADSPAPDRCGTCTRCIDACPTNAFVPDGEAGWSLDSRLCISYLTIEKRGEIQTDVTEDTTNHIFGCDVCQEVCPWNRRAPVTEDAAFAPASFAPRLEQLAELTDEEFRFRFRQSPVLRTKYAGFLRNVAIAMGNSGRKRMRRPLEKLAAHSDPLVAATAKQALTVLARRTTTESA
jgi:epoxyqueuosine reductase